MADPILISKIKDSGNVEHGINATKVNGHTVESDVPANAKFTDNNTNYYHTRTYSSGLKLTTGTGVSDMYAPVMTSSQLGVAKVAGSSTSAVATTPGTTSGKYYGVGIDSNNQLYVNVPWSDTNTDTKVTDAAGTGKAYLLGHSSQGTNATAITNGSCYMQNGYLYSGGLLPNADGSGKLGNSSYHWGEIHGNILHLSDGSLNTDGGVIYFGDSYDEDEESYCYIGELEDDELTIYSNKGTHIGSNDFVDINTTEFSVSSNNFKVSGDGAFISSSQSDSTDEVIPHTIFRLTSSGIFIDKYIYDEDEGEVTLGTSKDLFNLPDTKNTAGATNSTSKLFLVGAGSQTANPQTYSRSSAYIGTDGCLYSNSAKVLTYIPSTNISSKIYLVGATSQNSSNTTTYSDDEVYTTSGVLTTKSVQVGGGSATMQYDSTNECVKFVFA